MPKKLVTLVTDSGFLVPSLVAARELVDHGVPEIADIRIYTIGVDAGVGAALADTYKSNKIEIIPFETKSFIPNDMSVFHKNHVPIASLARLSLHEVLEEKYEDIVYLDGDIQIVGDLRALMDYEVPDGMIMAGRGSAWLESDTRSGSMTPRRYLENLGGVKPEQYFNAGVLAFKRATWARKAPEALRFFFENPQACPRHDQSALNAVFKGQVLELAPRYNFHNVYAELHVQRSYKPAIIHFTGPNKPWGRATPPWGGRFRAQYRQVIQEHPFLAPFLDVPPPAAPTASEIKAFLKHTVKGVRDRARVKQMRESFFRYADGANFPFH